MRENRVRVSDTELQTIKNARSTVYDDSSVPMGVVIRRACQHLMAEEEGSKVKL